MKFILLSFLLSLSSAFAGIVPANNVLIPADSKSFGTGLSQQKFEELIQKMEAIYQPEFKKRGLNITFDRKWSDPVVNSIASMGPDSRDRIVYVYGGLARSPEMNEDAFLLVLCHEIGHHLGGFPEKHEGISAEGEADYFATLKCARRVFLHDDNLTILKTKNVSSVAKSACAKAWGNMADYGVCVRTSVAAQTLSRFFVGLSKASLLPKFETPDLSKVAITNESYPSLQCRMDTYFQGALCERSYSEDLSDNDEVSGACHSSVGDKVGARPLCWFAPKTKKI
jgi:hypothetical protein